MASVYKKRSTWYIRNKDAAGRWHVKAPQAQTKTEARRLAQEAAVKAEKEGWGLCAYDNHSGQHRFLEDLLRWWLQTYSLGTPSGANDASFVAKHFYGNSFGARPLRAVTASAIEVFLQSKSHVLSPKSINHLRGYLGRAFNKAIKVGTYHGTNPRLLVTKRRVSCEMLGFLKQHEVLSVLQHIPPKWLPLFATAIYNGMRKGELLALQANGVDLQNRLLTVTRSHARNTTKNGLGAVIPIAIELAPYPAESLHRTSTHLVFPGDNGKMLSRYKPLEDVLRPAMGHVGMVERYMHVCRSKGCKFFEETKDGAMRRCPQDNNKLWPKAVVSQTRFHDLRHTTASLLIMSGANPAAVQRIMRHTGPKMTTEIYGHLSPDYLRAEADKLSFNPPAPEPIKEIEQEDAVQALNSVSFVTEAPNERYSVSRKPAGKGGA